MLIIGTRVPTEVKKQIFDILETSQKIIFSKFEGWKMVERMKIILIEQFDNF